MRDHTLKWHMYCKVFVLQGGGDGDGFFSHICVPHCTHIELPFDPDFVGSAVAYTKALELGYHREYVAIFNRGWSREESGDIQGALSDYLHTLELNPFFQQAARSVARLRAKAEDRAAILQDIAECEQKLEHLLAIGETPAIRSHLYVQMGYNYDALRENEKALDCYGKVCVFFLPSWNYSRV